MSQSPPKVSRSRSFIQSIGIGYVNQLVVLLAGLLLTPYFVRTLGVAGYGAWLVLWQGLALLGVIDLGQSFLLLRKVSTLSGLPWTKRSTVKFGRLVGDFLAIRLLQTAALASILVLFSRYFPQAVKENPKLYYLFLALYTTGFLVRPCLDLLAGLEEQRRMFQYQFAGWAANVSVCMWLVHFGFGPISMAIAWSCGDLVASALCALRLLKKHRWRYFHVRIRLERLLVFKYLASGKWQFLNQLSQVLNNASDIAILGRMSGEHAATSYALTGKLFSIGQNLPTQMTLVATPGMFQVASERPSWQPQHRFFRVFSAVTLVTMLMSGGLVCVIATLNHDFVSWWVGAGLFGGYRLSLAIGVSTILKHFAACLAFGCLWLGRERDSALCTVLGGVVTVLLAVPFALKWGAEGIVWANLLGVGLVTIPIALMVLRSELNESSHAIAPAYSVRSILAPYLGWTVRVTVLLALGVVYSRVDPFHGLVGIAIKGVLGSAVYLVFLRPVIAGPYLAHYVSDRVKSMKIWIWFVLGLKDHSEVPTEANNETNLEKKSA